MRRQSVSIDGSNMDITAPDYGVEVQVRDDGKVLWVSVDGVTVLRICQIPYLEIQQPRKKLHRVDYYGATDTLAEHINGGEDG